MKILSVIIAASVLNTSLLSCKSRATSAQAKAKESSAATPLYTEQQKQAIQYFDSLPDNEKAIVIDKANASTQAAASMNYDELLAEFTRLSTKFYSKQGEEDFAKTLNDTDPKNKDKRIAAGNEIYLYSAIRLRADKEYPTMKEDVYKALFERDDGKMLDIKSTQFMDPHMLDFVSLGGMATAFGGLMFVTSGVGQANRYNSVRQASGAVGTATTGVLMIIVGSIVVGVAQTARSDAKNDK